MISTITPDDLVKHLAWLEGEEDGVRIVTEWGAYFCGANFQGAKLQGAILQGAKLQGAKLQGAILQGAKLRGADLQGAILQGAKLRDADLRDANLQDADLWGANLRDADLRGADLWGANLQGANLRDADLRDADLWGANLQDADLWGADLRGANLRGAKNIPDDADAVTRIIAEGQLIVYKKLSGDAIATLRIPAEAKRSNATGRKCRAEYAEVVAIQDANGKEQQEGVSKFDTGFCYRVGETVRADEWCDDRWQECAGGIHFFLTRYEAENY